MLKITFVMIVCDGDEFLKECLECIYPYAHKICIAEGATRNWMSALGRRNARSHDNTLKIIKEFKDKENKIILHTQEAAYKDKDDQINRAMRLVPHDTDYVWELDSDELYFGSDVEKIIGILDKEHYTYVEFYMYNFFKNIDTVAYGTKRGSWGYDTPIPRVFKYHPGAKFKTHRPPTLLNESGKDVKNIKPLLAADKKNIKAYHYSYITDKQVKSKLLYYEKVFKRQYIRDWYRRVWLRWDDNKKDVENKFSVHPSSPGYKTKSFVGNHPLPIMVKYGRK